MFEVHLVRYPAEPLGVWLVRGGTRVPLPAFRRGVCVRATFAWGGQTCPGTVCLAESILRACGVSDDLAQHYALRFARSEVTPLRSLRHVFRAEFVRAWVGRREVERRDERLTPTWGDGGAQ